MLTLRQVAERGEVSESTVKRETQGGKPAAGRRRHTLDPHLSGGKR